MLQKRGNNMSNDERIAVLETTINHIDASLMGLRQDMKSLQNNIDNLNNKIDNRFDKLNDRLWSLLTWTIGGFVGVIGIMAHGFHWV